MTIEPGEYYGAAPHRNGRKVVSVEEGIVTFIYPLSGRTGTAAIPEFEAWVEEVE